MLEKSEGSRDVQGIKIVPGGHLQLRFYSSTGPEVPSAWIPVPRYLPSLLHLLFYRDLLLVGDVSFFLC